MANVKEELEEDNAAGNLASARKRINFPRRPLRKNDNELKLPWRAKCLNLGKNDRTTSSTRSANACGSKRAERTPANDIKRIVKQEDAADISKTGIVKDERLETVGVDSGLLKLRSAMGLTNHSTMQVKVEDDATLLRRILPPPPRVPRRSSGERCATEASVPAKASPLRQIPRRSSGERCVAEVSVPAKASPLRRLRPPPPVTHREAKPGSIASGIPAKAMPAVRRLAASDAKAPTATAPAEAKAAPKVLARTLSKEAHGCIKDGIKPPPWRAAGQKRRHEHKEVRWRRQQRFRNAGRAPIDQRDIEKQMPPAKKPRFSEDASRNTSVGTTAATTTPPWTKTGECRTCVVPAKSKPKTRVVPSTTTRDTVTKFRPHAELKHSTPRGAAQGVPDWRQFVSADPRRTLAPRKRASHRWMHSANKGLRRESTKCTW